MVTGNYVLSAGNSMYGGLGFDPLFGAAGTSPQAFGFTGARVQIGVAVNGMLDTTVSGNTLTLTHVAPGEWPNLDNAAEISAGCASGSFSPQPVDANLDGCV